MNKYLMGTIGLFILCIMAVFLVWTPTITATDVDREWYQESIGAQQAQSVETIILTGLTAAYTAVHTDGVRFSNDGGTFLHVTNDSGATMTVTVATQLTVEGLAVEDLEVAVATGAEKFIGPFPTTTFNVQSGTYINYVYVTPSSYDADFKMAILTF